MKDADEVAVTGVAGSGVAVSVGEAVAVGVDGVGPADGHATGVTRTPARLALTIPSALGYVRAITP